MNVGWCIFTVGELIGIFLLSSVFAIAVTVFLRAVCLTIYYIVEIIRDWLFWRF